MNHSASRHAGNVLTLFGLLVLAIAGLDRLMIWLGCSPAFGCWLRPIEMLGQAIAIAAVSLGVLLALVPRTRPLGGTLIVVGVPVAFLPGFLGAHLGVLCTRQ